jgi:hypothetical protein
MMDDLLKSITGICPGQASQGAGPLNELLGSLMGGGNVGSMLGQH